MNEERGRPMRLGSSIRRRRGGSATGRGDGDGPSPETIRAIALGAGVTVAGLLLGWLLATRLLFPAPPAPGDLYEVPDVRGTDLDEAADRLDRGGLSLGVIEGLNHPTADSGRVVGQAPLPGQLALPNAPVRVTLSLGAERREVPDLVELRADRARNVLESTGFHVVVDSVESDVPGGRVAALQPDPGSLIALPGEVRMTVSLGPPGVQMPSLVGLSEEEARDTLTALGLVVGSVEEVFRFGRSQGRVVEQDPPPDSVVDPGSAVRLQVGRRGGNNPSPGT